MSKELKLNLKKSKAICKSFGLTLNDSKEYYPMSNKDIVETAEELIERMSSKELNFWKFFGTKKQHKLKNPREVFSFEMI